MLREKYKWSQYDYVLPEMAVSEKQFHHVMVLQHGKHIPNWKEEHVVFLVGCKQF